MNQDHPSFGDDEDKYLFGGVAGEILNQISMQIEEEMDEETLKIMKDRVEALEGPHLAAFILGKFFGQLAIMENEPRMFHAAVACLWFSSVFTDFSDASTASELMDLAERCWVDAQKSIQDVISSSVDKLIEEI